MTYLHETDEFIKHREAITHLLQFLADRKHVGTIDLSTVGAEPTECWSFSHEDGSVNRSWVMRVGDKYTVNFRTNGNEEPFNGPVRNGWWEPHSELTCGLLFLTPADAERARLLENAVKYLEGFAE